MLPEQQSGAVDHPFPAIAGYDGHHSLGSQLCQLS
jgi:hypothetical protein